MPKPANPGSPKAKGCLCSRVANNYGAERPLRGWFVTALCPVHTLAEDGEPVATTPAEIHRANAAKCRELADQLDGMAAELDEKGAR